MGLVSKTRVYTWILSVITLVLFSAALASTDGQCIKGKYHKDKPSLTNGTFQTCTEYSTRKSCCKAEFTVELAATRTEKLYNHTWDLCKNLSSECLQFWLHQECFYQCSPYLYKWAHPVVEEGIHGVPICSSFCDGWFNACKNDLTCVQDVLTGYKFLPNGTNICPSNSSCVTYEKMFINGEGLCNKMWNSSYRYTKENSDRSNCMVMHFSGEDNPNLKFFKKISAAMSYSASLFIILFAPTIALYIN